MAFINLLLDVSSDKLQLALLHASANKSSLEFEGRIFSCFGFAQQNHRLCKNSCRFWWTHSQQENAQALYSQSSSEPRWVLTVILSIWSQTFSEGHQLRINKYCSYGGLWIYFIKTYKSCTLWLLGSLPSAWRQHFDPTCIAHLASFFPPFNLQVTEAL